MSFNPSQIRNENSVVLFQVLICAKLFSALEPFFSLFFSPGKLKLKTKPKAELNFKLKSLFVGDKVMWVSQKRAFWRNLLHFFSKVSQSFIFSENSIRVPLFLYSAKKTNAIVWTRIEIDTLCFNMHKIKLTRKIIRTWCTTRRNQPLSNVK